MPPKRTKKEAPAPEDAPTVVMNLAREAGVSFLGAMDRVIREFGLVASSATESAATTERPFSMYQAARVLSLVIGEPVACADLEQKIRERCRVISEYRSTLAQLIARTSMGIEQRTPEWYAARDEMITASDFAQALGCAKFGTQKQFYQKKCGAPEERPAFDPSVPPLKWGVMFEPVACMLYREMNQGVVVHEFGLLRHPRIQHLGASPDGITEDGIMLEIKCPWRRKIDGSIPLQYYYQIQGQLEVTGLKECDYFECSFSDVRMTRSTDADFRRHVESELNGKTNGVFIEVVYRVPGESESKFRFEYPPHHLGGASSSSIMSWLEQRQKQLEHESSGCDKIEKSDKIEEIEIVEIVEHWWTLEQTSLRRVCFDQEFVDRMLEKLGDAWNNVTSYRDDRSLYLSQVSQVAKATDIKSSTKKAAPVHVYSFMSDEEGESTPLPGGQS